MRPARGSGLFVERQHDDFDPVVLKAFGKLQHELATYELLNAAFDFHAELKTVVARKCSNDEMPAGLMAKIERCFGLDGPTSG